MRKKYIFTGFGLLIVILAIAIIFNIDQNTGQGSKENETIQISGGEEGTAWSITNSKVLRIAENGMTVGGNLGELIQIECEPEVSDLTIKDLETEEDVSIFQVRKAYCQYWRSRMGTGRWNYKYQRFNYQRRQSLRELSESVEQNGDRRKLKH